MEKPKPWLILGRVLPVKLRRGPDDVDAVAEAQHASAGEAEENAQAQLEKRVVAVDAVYEFTISVARPPQVTVVTPRLNSHPDPKRPDLYPYIGATGSFCFLAHFAAAPHYGTNFKDKPKESHLVVVRRFRAGADGLIRASAEHVPVRPSHIPELNNIESIALLCNDDEGSYRIAELIVTTSHALLVCFRSDSRKWFNNSLRSPMDRANSRGRGCHRVWSPHGAVAINSSALWFDLSWGILSCDLNHRARELEFHDLPPYRALDQATPDIHTRRCITVSGNLVRYVEVIPNGQAATVAMWYLRMGEGYEPWEWIANYMVSFQDIWNDSSYAETGLSRNVPVLAAVSPVNSDVVYFALDQQLFGVNVPARRVEHHEAYALMNVPGLPQQQLASGRYLVSWNLDPDHKAINFGHQAAEHQAAQQSKLIDDEVQLDRMGKWKATGSRQKSSLPSSRPSKSSRRS